MSVEEDVGNYLTAELPSSGRRGSFRGSRISSVGHSHSGSMDLMETGSLPSGFRYAQIFDYLTISMVIFFMNDSIMNT